jgi:hypothetical protein
MTRDKHEKRAARAYAAEHGIAYVHAKRLLAGRPGGQAGPIDPPPPGELGSDDEWSDAYQPKSLDELVAGWPASECDRLIGQPLHATHLRGADGIALNLELLPRMSEPYIHLFDLQDDSTDIQVDEEFEGGSLACNVTTSGTLTVEALMAKGDAISAAEAGQVRIFEPDFNRHDSSVIFDVEVEVSFEAILNPEYEGVEDFRFVGATVLSQ